MKSFEFLERIQQLTYSCLDSAGFQFYKMPVAGDGVRKKEASPYSSELGVILHRG